MFVLIALLVGVNNTMGLFFAFIPIQNCKAMENPAPP
jgi:hypothetical protein